MAVQDFTLSVLLQACPATLSASRDAALRILTYDTGLRMSEVTCAHIAPEPDSAAVLTVPRSQSIWAYAWLSPDTMRRVIFWQQAASLTHGALFPRIGVVRTKARAVPSITAPAGPPGYVWRLPPGTVVRRAPDLLLATVTSTLGEGPLTPAAVRLIIKRIASRAADEHLVGLVGPELGAAFAAMSTHTLRVGLTRDLFASGEDAGPIVKAWRRASTATALRYGRKLAPSSNATARMLRPVRGPQVHVGRHVQPSHAYAVQMGGPMSVIGESPEVRLQMENCCAHTP